MEPRLVAVRGPLKGSILLLPEGRYSVGRQAKNNLHLDENAVSREHCVFNRSGQDCLLKDLESRNGTLVNGTPITEQELSQGDEIRIGSSVFCFLVANDKTVETQGSDSKTRELRLEDAVYLSSVTELALPPSARALHDLRTLLRVSTILHSFRGLHDVHGAPAAAILRDHLSSLLLELIPAERGAVLIPGTNLSRDWIPNPAAVERIVGERIALWLEDANGKGLSVLGAPLMVRGEVAAVVYLESLDPRRKFDEGHLQLLTAVAGMAANAWENATILSWLQEENERLATELKLEHDMVGVSAKLRELQRQISKAAPSNSTVLILGESGTGKELVARALHRNSLRAGGPFVAINCAALADNLLESELFGHEKGAFTGAITAKKGKLEIAEGGTVFLDEIGELSPLLQAKLLRVLQQREMEHVGGTKIIKLDIRVIAATNRDIEDAVKKGLFRQDLYYRLNVVVLKSPPLRDRPEDTLPLAEHFAKKYSQDCGRKITGLSPEARAYLQSYSWPGNVRELENAIERAVVLGSADTILAEDLPEQIRESRPADVSASQYEEAIEAAKRQVVLKAFDQADYDHETAAKILGLHPNYLHKLIRTMDLKAVIKRAGR
ncbi:MAG TPA: sigma 54-interacting transcriptional regulator [Bryobacteraceae bacterium]|nr:sigma 54-interacting transcriptional regulator [Bryobacteraceae bacterium]